MRGFTKLRYSVVPLAARKGACLGETPDQYAGRPTSCCPASIRTVLLLTLRLSGHGVDAYLYTRGSRLRAFSLWCAYGQLLQSCAPLQVSKN
jgi:hypothetical protein